MIWIESIITVMAPLFQGTGTIMAMVRTSRGTDITMVKGYILQGMDMNTGTAPTHPDMVTTRAMEVIIHGMVDIITVMVDFISQYYRKKELSMQESSFFYRLLHKMLVPGLLWKVVMV
ncbi:hypothetical protein [Halobacillus sp. Nhm2S1]|uniref:hypothetical protein n=1 Tax=Halobacillus sp. Nhm2S1 TaxID=2866716 RepID=UPI001C73C1E0|nr:hypothetical protein [Halobacillus sp. Nhm2S1]MBX0358578.1 hypothetical protein [Halobacillus sp. Nhm2S1]